MSRRHVAGFLIVGAVVVLPLTAADQPVTHISGDQTRAAFAKGKPLFPAVGAKTIAKDELRGPSIEGGTATRLARGDVLIVPNSTAHQFTEVSAPFLYNTVKVTAR